MTILKALRLHMGMDIAEMSRAIATHPTNVYRLEAGKAPAGPRVRAKVSGALSRPEHELFDASGWPLAAEESTNA